MTRVVDKMGDDAVKTIALEALETFLQGGISRTDGQGQRTLGGVFFKLVKDTLE